jgi:LPS sulfotransferase NodH
MSADTRVAERMHVIHRLYSAQADFNCFGAEPLGSYMLATVPRSGSTYCAIRLWQSGLLGAPMEYLNFPVMGQVFRRLGYTPDEKGLIPAERIRDYWRDIRRLRTSLNGVFGFKMFPANYIEIARSYPTLLEEITPNYVVYLTRRDEVGQAMSYSRARRSKTWFAGVENTLDVPYDFDHIKSCLYSVQQQKKSWEDIFERTGVAPIRIFYEDLLDDGSGVVETVLHAMGIETDANAAVEVPMILRQSDGMSREWRERFAQDQAATA